MIVSIVCCCVLYLLWSFFLCLHLMLFVVLVIFFVFFFKQKTAYEMRISDWSSDVCSSDLPSEHCRAEGKERQGDYPVLAAPAAQERCAILLVQVDPVALAGLGGVGTCPTVCSFTLLVVSHFFLPTG